MAQSLADIVLHIVFSTKERKPWIDAVNEPELYKTQTFKEEYLTMLKMAQIEYDEKYLWD